MRYGKSMSEALAEIREGFSKKEIKMAIGVASDPRYKQGNYSGAVRAIEKIKKGLSKHPQVAAVLKRQNENFSEQPEHEITVGDYTTKHFHMCGSAQTVMKKHADKEGAKELTMLQDLFYKMEMEAMEAGSVTDEQKKKSQILYDKIIAKAEEVGIKDEVDKYMKLHLDSMIKGDPKLGFGRTDKQEALDKEDEPKVKEIIKKLKGASKAHAGQADDLEKAVKEEVELDEVKTTHVVIDTADGDKVVGTASSEKGAKEIITTAQLPPMKIKDKKTLKIVKVKKKQMIGYPIKEETELDEASIDMRDHDRTDPDFQDLIKKLKLKAKDLKGDDGTTVTGNAKDIEKMLSTMYGNDWKDMYKQKGQKYLELGEQKRVFRVSSDKLQGNVHAKDEKEAEKIFRKKGAKGKITITDRGPVRHYRRAKHDYDLVKEGTWTVPDTPAQKRELKKLLSKPLPLGKEGENAADKMYSIIGDDELFDDLYVAGKKDPKGDARPIIKKAMKRLKIKEEVELDEAKEVLSRFRDDKLKKSIMNLATQKGLKVKEMGDKLEVSGNAKKVMDLTLAVQKHDVKIEQNIMSAYTAAITKQLGVR